MGPIAISYSQYNHKVCSDMLHVHGSSLSPSTFKSFSTKKSLLTLQHITSITCFTFGFMSRVIVSNNVPISNIYNLPCRLYSNIGS